MIPKIPGSGNHLEDQKDKDCDEKDRCAGCNKELDGEDTEGEYCMECHIDRAENMIEDR